MGSIVYWIDSQIVEAQRMVNAFNEMDNSDEASLWDVRLRTLWDVKKYIERINE